MFAALVRPVSFMAGAVALAALAACGGETLSRPADDFKPVPVTPLLGDAPQGAENAPVTLIEYASLVCSHCRDFAKQVLPRLKREYVDAGKLKYIYRDMSIDPGGLDIVLATLTRCKGPEKHHALVEDFFANYADIMESAQKGEAATVLADITAKHGMTWDEARTCMDHTPALKAFVEKSGNDGEAEAKAKDPKLTGRKTPTIFVNGKYLGDRITYEDVKAAIDEALGVAPAAPAPAAPAPAAPPAQ